jgi:hypothetical protein
MKNILKIALGGLLGALVLWYIIFPIFPPATTPTHQKPISQELTQPITPKPSQPPVARNQSSMDNILELLIKNKEWLFSGIGIVLIVGLFSFFRKLVNLQKRKSAPFSGPQNLKVITGSPSTPTIIETKPPPNSPPTNIIPLESLSPEEIYNAINKAPLLQQEDVTKHYIGLKVKWEGVLSSAYKEKDDIVRILIKSEEYNLISFNVNKNDYPGLGLLKKGTLITVEGIIDQISAYFYLKDARIISVTSHDANSLNK